MSSLMKVNRYSVAGACVDTTLVCVCLCLCEPLYMYVCPCMCTVVMIHVHVFVCTIHKPYGNMVNCMVEMCALLHMYSPIGFVPHSMQADPKTILSHDQMMQDYPRFSENLKRELTEEEKAKFIVSIMF